MNTDTITALAKRSLDILFFFNPRATSIGLLLGVVADGFTGDLGTEMYHTVAAGILLCNLPSMITGRRELPKEFEDALEMIRRSRDTLSATQRRMQYLALVDQATRRISDAAGPTKQA